MDSVQIVAARWSRIEHLPDLSICRTEDRDKRPVFCIVVEVQLDIDPDKPFSWPAYLANLRSRLRCDVELLVVTPAARVARWARRPIPLGRGQIRPLVVGSGGMPGGPDPATEGHALRPPRRALRAALIVLAEPPVYVLVQDARDQRLVASFRSVASA